jgi:hypothetical protein
VSFLIFFLNKNNKKIRIQKIRIKKIRIKTKTAEPKQTKSNNKKAKAENPERLSRGFINFNLYKNKGGLMLKKCAHS